MSWVITKDCQFTLFPGESLLDGLERTGHIIEYQCRSGYCGSCRITILKGRVHYEHTPLAYVPKGQVLPCCCTPKGDVLLECYVSDRDVEVVKE